jgi:predicted transcriptional regulator
MSNQLINLVVSTFGLTKTDAEILKVLIQQKSGLLISEITGIIKRSERTVRQSIKKLLEKGILKRDVEILKNKRLAYRYNIRSKEALISKAKKHLLNQVGELNELA